MQTYLSWFKNNIFSGYAWSEFHVFFWQVRLFTDDRFRVSRDCPTNRRYTFDQLMIHTDTEVCLQHLYFQNRSFLVIGKKIERRRMKKDGRELVSDRGMLRKKASTTFHSF